MNRVQLACLLSFGTGFLSLSQEILFVRLVGFVFFSTPEAFAFVLACFLMGVALGAAAGKRICARSPDLRLPAAIVLTIAATVDAYVPWFATVTAGWMYASPAMGAIVVATAALKSVVFPIAHQLGADTSGNRLGRSISRVYASNIAGSSLGPVVTGFWLLDQVGLESAFLIVALGTFTLALTAAIAVGRRRAMVSAAVAFAAVGMATAVPAGLTRGVVTSQLSEGMTLGTILEQRSGIVHTVKTPAGGDIVFGGNVYDGRINTSLVVNSNAIDRAYVLALLHPNPRRILVIGLSTGAWTQVVTTFPGVERVDVVEINPAYLELIALHPEVSGLLSDPRVHIHVDDGRRWLRRHQHERYDLIVMNTTFHWRAYATNLLSREFMAETRAHLAQGGVFVFNTTESPDAAWTAASVFPFVRLFLNSAYCSDHDFTRGLDSRSDRLYSLTDRGERVLKAELEQDRAAVDKMLRNARFTDPADRVRHAGRTVEVVTDHNMITEFRYGRPRRLFPGP